MNCFDFISESPKFFIFEKDTNKTNFGGILMLINIIIMIIIIIYYSIDYANTPDYAIQYKQYINFYDIDQRDNINKYDEEKNPEVEFSLNVMSKKIQIKLFDIVNQEIINTTIIRRKVSDLILGFLYECHNENCTIDEIDDNRIEYRVEYKTFYLDHQNQNSPILEGYDFIVNNFYVDNLTRIICNWRNIIYKEKKGFFKKEEKSTVGFINDCQNEYVEGEILSYKGKKYKGLHVFAIKNDHRKEDEYERNSKSLIDFIANAISYFPNIYSILKFIFEFYSKNFNNYKIIDKILFKRNNQTMLTSLSDISVDEDNSNNDNLKINSDLNKENEKKKELIDIENNWLEKENVNSLKKLRFIHFFLNNIYCECCSKNDTQELINICNTILSKYLSIDSIAYNQILLENLFKDYKWNNPELSNIDNNELIINLKKFIT